MLAESPTGYRDRQMNLCQFVMCSSKKGVSANHLARELEVTYKTSWFTCHRVRGAMLQDPLAGILGTDRDNVSRERAEDPVSVAPLAMGGALKELLAIPDPAATKPQLKRKKAAPPPKE